MSTLRRAQVFRCDTYVAAQSLVADRRLVDGDLAHIRSTDVWCRYDEFGFHVLNRWHGWFDSMVFDDNSSVVTLDRLLTDPYADALEHYRDASLEMQRHDSNIALVIYVSPRDIGFRRAFAPSEADWMLCEQWHTIGLALFADEWWIVDVNFQPGRCFLQAATVRSHFATPVAGTNRNPNVYVTRDLSRLVDAYREWLQQRACAFLVFRQRVAELMPVAKLLESAISRYQWHVVTAVFCADVVAVRIGGPESKRAAAILAAPFRRIRQTHGVRLLSVVGPRLRRRTGALFNYLDYDWLLQHSRTTRFIGNWWVENDLAWPTLHRFVLDTALALAPLALPPYVLLEILEWLPRLRCHVHKQVIDLIEGVTRSVRRLCAARSECSGVLLN